MNTRSFWLSTLIAGAVIGVLGNLPLLNLINCALCIFVWLGGGLAVYLYRRYEHGPVSLSTGQAAGLGAVAGVIGAAVGAVVYLATSAITIPMFNALIRYLHVQGPLPFRNDVGGVVGPAFFFFCLDLVLYPLFGALGAMIAGSMIKSPAPVASEPPGAAPQ
jgi:hypothetical protein